MKEQEALDEILEVCKKHGVVLIGTCWSEGIYGEILVSPQDSIKWREPENLAFNELYKSGDCYYVAAIGNKP